MRKTDRFDPHTSFFDLKIVRRLFAAIFILSIFSATVIILNKNTTLTFNLSYEGFNNLLTLLKFPIGVLALLIPTVAVLVANHRSEQTKAQMKLTNHQISLTEKQLLNVQNNNNFSNYFKHAEEFEKYISNFKNDNPVTVNFLNPRKLHGKIFPNSKGGDYSACQKFETEIVAKLTALLNTAEGLSSHRHYIPTSKSLKIAYEEISDLLKMSEEATLANVRKLDQENPNEQPNTYKELLSPSIFICVALVKAFSFDETHTHNPLLISISNFNPTNLPDKITSDSGGFLGFNYKAEILNSLKVNA